MLFIDPRLRSIQPPPRIFWAAQRPEFFPYSRVFIFLGGLLALAMGVVLFLFNPAQCQFYPLCFFHLMTGLQCPGCGSTRALHQLLHGHLSAALHYNALLIIALPFLFAAVARRLMARGQGKSVGPLNPKWIWAGLVALIIFGVLRNLPFSVFSGLRP
jgi:hypothetical protein